ncbi:uncharacterized protein LOC119281347 isoform X2 [Triticum dicoccoides]|uniref:uncharacterized protein LOC119281347 isoform X2 n=1 Tax=Triticum dicoccoides TaxID=85692 RepID=UPI000E7C4610|nr:uncharacterized protein LOC119281347 isoform X2 [Triticum dicoccoides]
MLVIQIASPADIRLPVRRNAAVTKTLLSSLSSYICPAGDAMLRSFPQARPLLRRMGFDKRDAYFFKQMGKGMLCTYALLGAAWLWNDTSPLGWRTLKPRPKEEKEMAHLYEHREFPYPGDEEAVEEFIKSEGALGTTIGPKGFADTNVDSDNMQKQLQSKKFDQEAQNLWFRMRNEVAHELQEKGFGVE